MNTPIKIYSIHILASLVFMGMLLGLLYFVRDFIQDVLLNSQQYFLTEHSIEQTNVNIIFIAIISIIVLISLSSIFWLHSIRVST